MEAPETTSPHGHRMSVGGRLSFRGRQRGHRGPLPEGLPLLHGGEDPPPLPELLPRGATQVEVEIGPGKGAFLAAAAELRPQAFLLGIEASTAYAEIAAERLLRAGSKRALVLIDNGKLYLADRVPDAALDCLHVYYPDPWPKRRHRGRRFFTPDVVPVLQRVLKAGGRLLVATDNAAYAGQICRVLGSAEAFRRDEATEQQLLVGPPGTAFRPTNFERKYEQEGRVLRRYAWLRR
jgi:tRNA (guanine-N7-)-methyltransferase